MSIFSISNKKRDEDSPLNFRDRHSFTKNGRIVVTKLAPLILQCCLIQTNFYLEIMCDIEPIWLSDIPTEPWALTEH